MSPHAAVGDDEALRQLVRRYHDRVYRFGVTVCRDSFDADDAVQEAFVTLARRPDVRESPTVLAWLFTVVRNACLAAFKTVGVRRLPLSSVPEALDVPDATLTPEASLERFQLVAAVQNAIAALEPEGREVLILRDLEGLSGEATAAELQLSVPAMKSRLLRARQAVRRRLTASGGA